MLYSTRPYFQAGMLYKHLTMKKFIFLVLLATVFVPAAQSQIQSKITSLQTSPSGINMAKVSLIYWSRDNKGDISILDSQMIMIPVEVEDISLKLEYRRFVTHEGIPFEKGSKTYIPVYLFYDMETLDPRDDLFLGGVPFIVDKKLILKELKYYEGQFLIDLPFSEAPLGNVSSLSGFK